MLCQLVIKYLVTIPPCTLVSPSPSYSTVILPNVTANTSQLLESYSDRRDNETVFKSNFNTSC